MSAADAVARRRGPHPLGIFLALALRLTGGDRARLAAILEGVRRYQQAPVPQPMPDAPVVARRGTVALRRIGGPEGSPAPVVVIPSLINAAAILDLAPGRSLVRYLAAQGAEVLMVDWGPLGDGERRLGLAGLVSGRLLPLILSLGRPVRLLGYCLGGTLAIGAAAVLGPNARALALIGAPWHFSGFPAEARSHALGIWGLVRPMARKLGAVPISSLNPLFWSLDENAVLDKYARLSTLAPDDPTIAWFALVEDWANSGAPLSVAAARDLFLKGFGQDLFGRGRWKVAGMAVDEATIACPTLNITATRDRIVPAATRIRTAGADHIEVDSGHVGMVVGGNAATTLWEPLSNWLCRS